ncbi:MAG TPA: hypothetical protein VN894_10525 [Polyangiaceae bacterium]|nr:hypothetical protein [Polyangiaceae bacterium]
MRRWALFLFFLAFGCASPEVPSRTTTDLPPDVGGGDDAGFGGGIGPGDLPPGDDGVAAMGADDSSPGPPVGGPSLAGSVDASADEEEVDPDATSDSAVTPMPPFDPGDGGVCMTALAEGDLVIDELMIESVAGAGDHGEWLEVQSTVGCALDLRGLHGDAPSGNKIRTFDVGGDLWIPALGRFVVADSNNVSINHDLPGTVVVWSGQPGDVLRNKGGTVTLQFGGAIIDSVTYPSMALTAGASLAFPSDCAPSRRSDWTAWQSSTFAWFPGFSGTPNAPNDDVQCP